MDRWINATTDLRQIAFRLAITFVICLCMSFCVGLYSQNVALKKELAAHTTENAELDAAFSGIYNSLELVASRYRIISDTHMRTQHYTKPHTSFQDLCPECGDLWGKKKKDIVWVPAARLAALREIERAALGRPKVLPAPEEAEPPIDVEEELRSIQFLLKAHASFAYTLLQTEMYTNHYAKKHAQPIPGLQGFGNCPECIDLYTRQTEATRPLSKARYEILLSIEKDHQTPKKFHGN